MLKTILNAAAAVVFAALIIPLVGVLLVAVWSMFVSILGVVFG